MEVFGLIGAEYAHFQPASSLSCPSLLYRLSDARTVNEFFYLISPVEFAT